MRGKQIEMHHIREVLRLKATGSSNRMISGCLGIARSTVADVVGRAADAGLVWPAAGELTDAALAAALFKRTAQSPHLGVRRHAEPDLARLRNRRFTSLAELNGAIATLVVDLNNRPMRRLKTTRAALFEAVEQHALRPLPIEPYVYAEWKICRVGLDYHVDVGGHYYSVPYRYLRAQVDVRIAARTVEIFFKGERIAAHMRQATCGRHTTQDDHMPETHRAYKDMTVEKVTASAERIGASTSMLVRLIIEAKQHPLQGVRSSLGIIALARQYGPERVEAACLRALEHGARSYGSVKSILEHKLDQHPLNKPEPDTRPIGAHPNVRGRAYYN